MADIKYQNGSFATLLSTELNSLANGSGIVASAAYDNATNLHIWGIFELNVTFGSAPTAGNLVNLYLEIAPDGTNYGDNQNIQTTYVGGFPLRAVTSAQRVHLGIGLAAPLWLPPTLFKLRAVNNSGQAFPASGSTIKFLPHRVQSV